VSPKQDTNIVQGVDARFLRERVMLALDGRTGYYVVTAEEKIGPLSGDAAYDLWEERMLGEVKYFDGYHFLNPDGSR
jgi:hypothetical protein